MGLQRFLLTEPVVLQVGEVLAAPALLLQQALQALLLTCFVECGVGAACLEFAQRRLFRLDSRLQLSDFFL